MLYHPVYKGKIFMKKILIAVAVALLLPLFFCTKNREKTETEIMNENAVLVEKAEVNLKIKNLESSLKSAENDFKRATIYQEISEEESKKGDISAALKNANAAVKYQPNLAKSHYMKGMAYLRLARYEESENELLTAIQLDNSLAPAHFELGNLYYKKGKSAKAVSEYLTTVKLDGKHFMAYNNLSVAYSTTGRNKEAVESLKKVTELKPGFAKAYKNLGIIYDLKLKDRRKAAENYRKYLRLRPNAPERKAVKLWIAELEGGK